MGKRAKRREREAREAAAVQAARPAALQADDFTWRRLGDARRDLAPVTHARMQAVADYLYHRNPLARRIINTQVEWIVGEGVTVEAEDPRTHDYLQEWWRLNRLGRLLPSVWREYALFGEDFAPAYSNRWSGLMRLGVMDPADVEEVVPDPDNAAVVIGVVQRAGVGVPQRRWRALLPPTEMEALSPYALRELERFADGEILTSATNKLRRATRGISDLFAIADWCDGYEQLLFAALNRDRAVANYFWDVELAGADEKEIAEYLADMAPPRPFSVFGHNEKVKRRLVGPEAGSATHSDVTSRLFRTHVLGGVGYGEHMYGAGGDVNRSTADAMDGGTIKSLTAVQTDRKEMLLERAAAQVERGIEVGHLRDTPETREIRVVVPDLSTKDLSRIASGLQSIASALSLGRRDGWATRKVATQFLASFARHAGVDLDAKELLEEAELERKRDLQDELGRGYDEDLRIERDRAALTATPAA
jgi:hypothetical protein